MNDYTDHYEVVRWLREPSALYTLSWGRDEADNFICRVDPLSTGSIPSKDEIDDIFPSGSKWTPAKGWRTIFGMPFSLHKKHYLAIGVESVYSHQRGAFPVFDAHVYDISMPPIDGIKKVITSLGVSGRDAEPLNATHGIFDTHSQTPEEHRQVEITVLRHALSSYKAQRRLLFSTLILTEDRLKMPGFPSSFAKSPVRNFVLYSQDYLMATVRSIKLNFSLPTKAWLWKNRYMG